MPLKKIYYGWTVCIVSTMLIFITMGTISNGFSVYLPYIINQNGFTYSQGSYLVTLRCLIACFSMLVIGFYYKIFSIRTGASIAAFCAGLAFFIYSISDTYVSFCIAAAISGISYGFGSMIPVSILMNRWFIQRMTLALSICATGSGIATIVLPSVTTLMIEYLSLNQLF
jgi:MFS family permease